MEPTRERRPPLIAVASLSMLLAVTLAACGGSGTATRSPGPAQPAIVQVELTDFAIAMPETIAEGAVTFKIRNSGVAPHNFEVEGSGIEVKLEPDLQAGESGELSVTLPPGAYEVYCTVTGHLDLGMVVELEVTAE